MADEQTTEKKPPDLSDKIAARLLEEYAIGVSSRFMDEPAYFYSAESDELAELIREVINANA